MLEDGLLRAYVNGVKVGEVSRNLTNSDFGDELEAYLGRSNYLADSTWAGSIQDLRVFGTALSDEEVAEVFGDPITQPASDVVRAELQDLVDEVETLDEDDYTQESWLELATALASAQQVLADEEATPSEAQAARQALAAARAALTSWPTDPQATAHYDMSVIGDELQDVSGNGRHAALVGIDLDDVLNLDEGTVLRFANNGYAALPHGLVTDATNDFTVEMVVATEHAANQFGWVIGDGVGPWNTTTLGDHIFLNPKSAQGGYVNQVLAAIRVKSGDSNGEARLPSGGGIESGFSTVTMTSQGNRLTVYIDGVQASTLVHGHSLSDIIPDGDVLGYIGRSLYQGDALLTADVASVKFWDEALSAEQVAESAPEAESLRALTLAVVEYDIAARLLGDNVAADQIVTDVVFPGSIHGITLTWETSNPDAISETGAVTRPGVGEADVPVQVKATDQDGNEYTFDLVVLAVTQSDLEAEVQADLDALHIGDEAYENLPMLAEGPVSGSTLVWTSSATDIVTEADPSYVAPAVGSADPYQGAGLVSRPDYGSGDVTVELSVTATKGGISLTRTFDVTVKERGRTAPDAGYASAYFKADSAWGQRVWMAATTENDFFTFEEVNDGEPVLDLQNPTVIDTGGLRDPYIWRSIEGDRYYMIATDLCVWCGDDWGSAQRFGSLKVHIWESTDLVNWNRTNDEDSGIVINQPLAGMTWAPEVHWDHDLQSYVVFFASRMYEDEDKTITDNVARMFYVITRDFVTFTYPPAEWQSTGHSRIDSTIMTIGDEYYRFTKAEGWSNIDPVLEAGGDIFLEKSTVLTAPTTQSDWHGNPDATWQLLDTNMTVPKTGEAGEGPQIVKLNEGDPNNTPDNDGYVFLVDNFTAGGYVPFVTTEGEITSSNVNDRLSHRDTWVAGSKDGLPPSPRHGAFVNASQGILDAMRAQSEVAATPSTTTVDLDHRTADVRVVAEDLGDVAGTVTLVTESGAAITAAGGLDPTGQAAIPLSAGSGEDGATVSVTVPGSVGGEVAVLYNGYHDGLVSESETSFSIEAVEEPVDVDRSALAAAIAAAEELEADDYTESSWAALVEVLDVARAVFVDESATQDEVDAAVAALVEAIGDLEDAGDLGDGGNGDDGTGDGGSDDGSDNGTDGSDDGDDSGADGSDDADGHMPVTGTGAATLVVLTLLLLLLGSSVLAVRRRVS